MRTEILECMAALCHEFGLVDQANALAKAAGTEFNRPEDMGDKS